MNISTALTQLSYYYDTYDSSYRYSSTTVPPEVSAFFMLVALLTAAVMYVIISLLLGRIFKKAGVPGWKAWVPVYNTWTMLELGGQKGYWSVLALIPFIGIIASVFLYIAMYNIGKKLGKEGAFVLWAIFVPLVWYVWLAVDSSKWSKSKTKKTAE
jgi:uncharacterized protein DUF5684